jgi:hypothetical protein
MIGQHELAEAITRSASLGDVRGREGLLEENVDPKAMVGAAGDLMLAAEVGTELLTIARTYQTSPNGSQTEHQALERLAHLLAGAGASCMLAGVIAGRNDARKTTP